MDVALKIRNGLANSTYVVSPSSTAFAFINTPGAVVTDANGYALLNFRVAGLVPNSAPQRVSVTLTSGSSTLTETMTVQSVNGVLRSAWPQVLLIEGAFCSPASSASAQLQISRALDLNGDGRYGDTISENNATRDPLDFPGEFTIDINTSGSAACNGGNPFGTFWPGNANYRVAFCADNRSVTGACNFTTKMNFAQDMSFGADVAGKGAAILWVSSGTDFAYIGRDLDGDGRITDSEIKDYFDSRLITGAANTSSDGIAVDPTNNARSYFISDGGTANHGLWQLTDANADDQVVASETKATWTDATAPAIVVDGQTIAPKEFECVHCGADGTVYVNDTAFGTIFAWKDANNDGLATSNEVTNFLTYNKTSSLTVSADFQKASFPTYTGYFPMNFIESVSIDSGEIVFLSVTTSSGSTAGYIFRCEDKNGNGTCNDLDEVTIFNDGGTSVNDPNPPNWTSGMDCATVDVNGDGKLTADEIFVYMGNPNGPKPNCGFVNFNDMQVWTLTDSNGDGDAFDAGEQWRSMVHPTGCFNRGLELVPAGAFAASRYNNSGVVSIGAGGCQRQGVSVEMDFTSDRVEEGCRGTPFAGNDRFEIVVRGALPNDPVSMGVGISALPNPIVSNGCNIWTVPLFVVPVGNANAQGEVRIPAAVPASAATGSLFVQSILFAGGGVTSEAVEIRIAQ